MIFAFLQISSTKMSCQAFTSLMIFFIFQSGLDIIFKLANKINKKLWVLDTKRWVAQSVSVMVTYYYLPCPQDGCMPDVCNMVAVILVLNMSKLCWVLSFYFVKFEINWQKHPQVTVCKQNLKMATILFFQMAPILQTTQLGCCLITLC